MSENHKDDKIEETADLEEVNASETRSGGEGDSSKEDNTYEKVCVR